MVGVITAILGCEMAENETVPQGVLAILIDKKGREIANATDFHQGAPGGFKLQEAQVFRAKRMLALRMVAALVSPALREVISDYEAERMLNNLCENGHKMVIVPIGYEVAG
jgi:hypothetical protein